LSGPQVIHCPSEFNIGIQTNSQKQEWCFYLNDVAECVCEIPEFIMPQCIEMTFDRFMAQASGRTGRDICPIGAPASDYV